MTSANACRFCGTLAKVRAFGDNWSIYCPATHDVCKYPPNLEGKDLGKLITQWNLQFGKRDGTL